MPDQQNEPGQSWWAEFHELKASVERRFEEGDVRMTSMQADIAENNRLTAETKNTVDAVKGTTEEIREFLATMKSLLKLGDMLSTVTIKIWKPISYVAGAIAAFATAWTIFRSGK